MTLWESQTAYLHAEWDQFINAPVLGRRTLDAIAGREVARVVDVGCGAGQELIPFVRDRGAFGVGVDVRVASLPVARELLAGVGLGRTVALAAGRAEAIPVRSGCMDAVMCRGVLVYTRVDAALAEIRRVMRPGAVAIVQVDTLRNDLERVARYARARNSRACRDALRRIAATVRYRLWRQPGPGSWTGSEVFFSRRSLTKELARAGLEVVGEVRHGNPRTFALVVTAGR